MPVYGMDLDPFGLQKHTHPPSNRAGHKHASIGDLLGKVGSSLLTRVEGTAQRLGNKPAKHKTN
jgi:hypothetical protein